MTADDKEDVWMVTCEDCGMMFDLDDMFQQCDENGGIELVCFRCSDVRDKAID